MARKKDPDEPEDFSHLEVPLNTAAKIIAQRQGREWNHTIRVTKEIPPFEFHAGRVFCKIHPRTISHNPDLLALVNKIFDTVDHLSLVEVNEKRRAIDDTKESVRRHLKFLRRALVNGEFTEFQKEIVLKDWR